MTPTAKCAIWPRHCLYTASGCLPFSSTKAWSQPTMWSSGRYARRCNGAKSVSATAVATANSRPPAYLLSRRLAKSSSATFWLTSLTLYAAIAVRLPHLLCFRSGPDDLNSCDESSKDLLQVKEPSSWKPWLILLSTLTCMALYQDLDCHMVLYIMLLVVGFKSLAAWALAVREAA